VVRLFFSLFPSPSLAAAKSVGATILFFSSPRWRLFLLLLSTGSDSRTSLLPLFFSLPSPLPSFSLSSESSVARKKTWCDLLSPFPLSTVRLVPLFSFSPPPPCGRGDRGRSTNLSLSSFPFWCAAVFSPSFVRDLFFFSPTFESRVPFPPSRQVKKQGFPPTFLLFDEILPFPFLFSCLNERKDGQGPSFLFRKEWRLSPPFFSPFPLLTLRSQLFLPPRKTPLPFSLWRSGGMHTLDPPFSFFSVIADPPFSLFCVRMSGGRGWI